MPPPAEGIASRLLLGPTLRTQPDRRLVTLVREGYEVAFEEIVRRYGRPLTRYAASIVGARSEDVTQDAFSKALLALRGTEAEIELRPWLYRIVRNTALNDLRDSPPAPEALAEAFAATRGTVEEVEQREELTELISRLRSLPEPQRAAIVMRELEGLGHDEIAANLGLSGGAARQAIYRARQALRDGLGMLVPLPTVRLLIDHGDDASAGAGAAGAAVLGGSAGGAAGALKAGVLVAVLAGSVGTGIALKDATHDRAATAIAAAAQPGTASDAREGGGGRTGGGAGPAGRRTADDYDREGDGESATRGGPGGEDRGAGGRTSPNRDGARQEVDGGQAGPKRERDGGQSRSGSSPDDDGHEQQDDVDSGEAGEDPVEETVEEPGGSSEGQPSSAEEHSDSSEDWTHVGSEPDDPSDPDPETGLTEEQAPESKEQR